MIKTEIYPWRLKEQYIEYIEHIETINELIFLKKKESKFLDKLTKRKRCSKVRQLEMKRGKLQ